MKNILYFDCISGISGDMVLGALFHLGVPIDKIIDKLHLLSIGEFKLKVERKKVAYIETIKINITFEEREKKGRRFHDIIQIIESSNLSKKEKDLSIKIFSILAKAEAEVHGIPVEEVHFHEVGALDSIVDIVGVSCGIVELGLPEIHTSPLPISRGIIECQHGLLPLPAPAVLNILKGFPLYGIEEEVELITPTGAAILKALSPKIETFPKIIIEKVGYGAGNNITRTRPNILRLLFGKSWEHAMEEEILVFQVNIDDMNPQHFEYLTEKLFNAGALDVTISQIQMKKGRPGVCLEVLSPLHIKDIIAKLIFTNTSSPGLRYHISSRIVLEREIKTIDSPMGKFRIKIWQDPEKRLQVYPEYEDIKRIAIEKNLPIKEVYKEITKYIWEKMKTVN